MIAINPKKLYDQENIHSNCDSQLCLDRIFLRRNNPGGRYSGCANSRYRLFA